MNTHLELQDGPLHVHMRYIIRRDLPEVCTIEEYSFTDGHDEESFCRLLRQKRIIGLVAEYKERVVGFYLCELYKRYYNIIDFAVHPECIQRGVGRQMLDSIKKRMLRGRPRLVISIGERNLVGQLFLKSQGFRAVKVYRNGWDQGEDAYCFEYCLSGVARGALNQAEEVVE